MTINKTQGQTIPFVGVYLPEPVFSHGQLYVVLSRATTKSNIKIVAIKDNRKDTKNSKMRKGTEALVTTMLNIVYKEVLSN
jgi:ATP-dependent DNA helicase PIF1